MFFQTLPILPHNSYRILHLIRRIEKLKFWDAFICTRLSYKLVSHRILFLQAIAEEEVVRVMAWQMVGICQGLNSIFDLSKMCPLSFSCFFNVDFFIFIKSNFYFILHNRIVIVVGLKRIKSEIEAEVTVEFFNFCNFNLCRRLSSSDGKLLVDWLSARWCSNFIFGFFDFFKFSWITSDQSLSLLRTESLLSSSKLDMVRRVLSAILIFFRCLLPERVPEVFR